MADTYLMQIFQVWSCFGMPQGFASAPLFFTSPINSNQFFYSHPHAWHPRPHRRSPTPSMPYLFFSGDKNDGLLVAVMFCWLLVDWLSDKSASETHISGLIRCHMRVWVQQFAEEAHSSVLHATRRAGCARTHHGTFGNPPLFSMVQADFWWSRRRRSRNGHMVCEWAIWLCVWWVLEEEWLGLLGEIWERRERGRS